LNRKNIYHKSQKNSPKKQQNIKIHVSFLSRQQQKQKKSTQAFINSSLIKYFSIKTEIENFKDIERTIGSICI